MFAIKGDVDSARDVSLSTKKRKLTVSSFTLYSDDITVQLLVLLVCMENVFKELYLHAPAKCRSPRYLSKADAKVETFPTHTKYFKNFF